MKIEIEVINKSSFLVSKDGKSIAVANSPTGLFRALYKLIFDKSPAENSFRVSRLTKKSLAESRDTSTD